MKTDCINWTKYRNKGGYGNVRIKGLLLLSHRAAWIKINGSIPEGLNVLHKCDNPACINTNHLYLGTQLDNARDRRERGRNTPHGKKGEENNKAKLTETDVREILESEQLTHKLAKIYHVSTSAIRRIRAKITWKHIKLESKNK